MVAQRGGDAQAGVGGESEATPATAQAEPQQNQQAPPSPMEAMLQLMMAKFDGVADAVQNIGMRVDAIERRESLPALEGAREETKIGQATVDPAAMAAGDPNGVLEPGPDHRSKGARPGRLIHKCRRSS